MKKSQSQQKHVGPTMNGVMTNGNVIDNDEMDLDEDDWGWEGTSLADRNMLGDLLNDCLATSAVGA